MVIFGDHIENLINYKLYDLQNVFIYQFLYEGVLRFLHPFSLKNEHVQFIFLKLKTIRDVLLLSCYFLLLSCQWPVLLGNIEAWTE